MKISSRDFFRVVIWVLFACVFASCSLSKNISYEDDEGKVPKAFFTALHKHQTQKSWVVKHLGPPYVNTPINAKKNIYSYRFKRVKHRQSHLFFVLRYSNTSEETEYLHILFENNIVRRSWWDHLGIVQATDYMTSEERAQVFKAESMRVYPGDADGVLPSLETDEVAVAPVVLPAVDMPSEPHVDSQENVMESAVSEPESAKVSVKKINKRSLAPK